MKFLVTLIVALLRVFLPALVEASKDTCEEGGRQPELKARLRKKVRAVWGDARMWILVPLGVLLFSGCGTRTIYPPAGEPVRLRETVKGAKVWVMGSDGKPVASKCDLPEGWYVLPDPGEDD